VIIWIDAQLSPQLAQWITSEFKIQAAAVRELGLREAKDTEIFTAARDANVVVMTKDSDFVVLQDRLGSPPSIIWLRCGNTSNAHLKKLLARTFSNALALLESGERLVEITDLT
jgi:predicted nuclease of predicted toxin-antitoxin system